MRWPLPSSIQATVGGGIPDALQVRFRLDSSTKVSSCIDWMDEGTAIKQKLHAINEINVERLPLYSFYCRFLLNWFSLHELHDAHPWCEWCVKVGHTTAVYVPFSFRTVVGFFYVPQEPDKWKCCETGPTVFCPYPRRLERITVRRCHYKGSAFFSVI